MLWQAGAVARRGAVGGGSGQVCRQQANREVRRSARARPGMGRAAERRHASAERSIFLTESAQLRQLPAGGRAGEQPSRPRAGAPHAPAPSAAQLGTGTAAAPPSRPEPPSRDAGAGRALTQGPRWRAMSPAGQPHPAPSRP